MGCILTTNIRNAFHALVSTKVASMVAELSVLYR